MKRLILSLVVLFGLGPDCLGMRRGDGQGKKGTTERAKPMKPREEDLSATMIIHSDTVAAERQKTVLNENWRHMLAAIKAQIEQTQEVVNIWGRAMDQCRAIIAGTTNVLNWSDLNLGSLSQKKIINALNSFTSK